MHWFDILWRGARGGGSSVGVVRLHAKIPRVQRLDIDMETE